MTNSFQSTAATNIYDSPVNTFVNPVTVLPKTGMMELADTLKTINPALQTYLQGQIEKEKQAGILQGEIDVLMASPDKLKEFYQQPPYLENADQVIEEMFTDLKTKFKKLLKRKKFI